jgi:hypothetical protein
MSARSPERYGWVPQHPVTTDTRIRNRGPQDVRNIVKPDSPIWQQLEAEKKTMDETIVDEGLLRKAVWMGHPEAIALLAACHAIERRRREETMAITEQQQSSELRTAS